MVARRKPEDAPPERKGAVISARTTVSLEAERDGTASSSFTGPYYHSVPVDSLQEFVDAVHEVVGSGSDELGEVSLSNGSITYSVNTTLQEGIK